jgi:hypothetical protein
MHAVAANVPCFEVRVGGRFVEERGLAEELLEELTRRW